MADLREAGRKQKGPSEERPKEVWEVLRGKGKWTSDELEKLLEEQGQRRDALLAKKGVVECEADRLTSNRKKDVKTELEAYRQTFVELQTAVNKMVKQKLPNRIDRAGFYLSMENAEELEKAEAYLVVLNFFISTSERIEANLESDLEMEAIELYHRLKRVELVYLNSTDCHYLEAYSKRTTDYWEARLLRKIAKDFERFLDLFGWPLRLKTAVPTLEAREKFRRSILYLSRISAILREGEKFKTEIGTQPATTFTPIIPIQIMMVPLRRRFRFHFLSDKPTSESTRPDWYFSQVKQWVLELIPFIKTHLEPVTVSDMGVSSIIEFARCMSEMLILKVNAHLSDDTREVIFVKLLEESINFENEITDVIIANVETTSNSHFPSLVDAIFSPPTVVQTWVEAERNGGLEKLDEMFASPTAWSAPIIPEGAPEIVELFLAVLRSLTDRFAHLQQASQHLLFVKLMNELLEEFHVRCLQQWKSKLDTEANGGTHVVVDYVIADALRCVHDTLQDWEYVPFFASLSRNIEDTPSTPAQDIPTAYAVGAISNGLFQHPSGLYWCLYEEIQAGWCIKMSKEIKTELSQYCRLKWQVYEGTPGKLSEQIVPCLQMVKEIIKKVSNAMDTKGVEKWMKKLAVHLDEMLVETVILPHKFSSSAIPQLQYDFKKGIIPLFRDAGVNEKLFFGGISSALIILGISMGEAMLLYETLLHGSFEDHEIALAELNITITQSEVIKILRNRCDLRF